MIAQGIKTYEQSSKAASMRYSGKGSSITTPTVQPKRSVDQLNDVYGQDAVKIADQVMQMSSDSVQTKPLSVSILQRKCAHCEDQEKKLQMKQTVDGERMASSELENYVGSLSGGGQPLSDDVRGFYEPHFGYDFSNVRVHTNTFAAKSAQSINALAYTSGNHIVFNEGQYSPDSNGGKKLLGHELTHVVQQQSFSSIQPSLYNTYEDDPCEIEAENVSAKIMNSEAVNVTQSAPVGTPQFGLFSAAKCAYYTWKIGDIITECRSEYQKACGESLISDECSEFMDGTGFPSDAIYRCVGRKNPEAYKNWLKSCAKTATGSYGDSKWTQNESEDSNAPIEVASSEVPAEDIDEQV